VSDTQSAPPQTAFRFEEQVSQCDVCAGTDFITVAREANIVQCRGCGYRFVNPRPSQREIAAAYSNPHFYDGWVADDAGREQMWAKRLRLVRQRVRGDRVLDVGAGIGTFLAMARDRRWRVAGTEVSTSAQALARSRHGIDLLNGQAEDLELSSNAFDVVTLWHVLEHVPSPSRLLRVCHDALRPGGSIVIAVPNDSDGIMLRNRIKRRVFGLLGRQVAARVRYERLAAGSEIHLSHFTLPVLERLLTKEGFHLRWVSVDDHYPNPGWKTNARVAAYRLINRLTGTNVGDATVLIAQRD
jgi:SAM-dependent methyltransferase